MWGSSVLSQTLGPSKDLKDLDPKELGLEFAAPAKDPRTGFVVAGKNSTALIRDLTEINRRRIAELERDMRPKAQTTDDAGSDKGFLGPREALLEVLAADNHYVVEELGLTHHELARHLRVLGAIGAWQVRQKTSGTEFTYHGRRFKVNVVYFRGYQHSPFRDGTKTNCDVTARNLSSGKKLTYSLLVPDMIERYGFYEGKGTPYRVEPREILELLDFLRKVELKSKGAGKIGNPAAMGQELTALE
jgi:hypothetical protein